uniref:Integrase core domain containing protein n=1 Tax=Solanum tuberosum TaxID=4113 RepID=M1DF63_SOLTU
MSEIWQSPDPRYPVHGLYVGSVGLLHMKYSQSMEPQSWTTPQSDEKATPIGSPTCSESVSNFGFTSGSSSDGATASSFETTSVGEIPVPPNTDHAPVAEEPNRWCMSGHWQIYRDTLMLTEKDRMARFGTEEHRVCLYFPINIRFISLKITKVFSMLVTELTVKCAIHGRRTQVGNKKELSANRQAVPRTNDRLPKITELKDVECQGEKAMEEVKGRLAEWFIEPDLLRQIAIRSLFFSDYKLDFEHFSFLS